jgi:hypothetical protein
MGYRMCTHFLYASGIIYHWRIKNGYDEDNVEQQPGPQNGPYTSHTVGVPII